MKISSSISSSHKKPNLQQNWIPAAAWCGRLILPEKSSRQGGDVSIELRQVPEEFSYLKGKVVTLRLAASRWTELATQDIEFTEATKRNQAKGNLSPERLNGWDLVSPLESLAGARLKDDMLVSLGQVTLEDNPPVLTIENEPVQVSGSEKALVRFEKKLPNGRWRIRHWNKSSRDFTGPYETVECLSAEAIDPLLDTSMNQQGYYLYAEPTHASGNRLVKALEPRSVTSLVADQVMLGKRRSLWYLNSENWRVESLKKGEFCKTLLDADKEEKHNPIDIRAQVAEHFYPGQTYLVVHNFGGKGEGEGIGGLTTGHMSVGTAQVVKDEFTAEPRLDIEYSQVYAHNPEGIVAGRLKWHSYMASLESSEGSSPRGWMYHRPISDVLVKVPELQQEGGFKPLDILQNRLSEMTARYRTGEGDGAAIVTAAQSCSADTAQALFAAAKDWERAVAGGLASEEVLNFSHLIVSQVAPLCGLAPAAWHRTAKALEKADPKRGRWLPALLSPKTVLPRDHADGLVGKLLESKHTALILKTDIILSDPAHLPAPPTTMFTFWQHDATRRHSEFRNLCQARRYAEALF